MARRVLSVLAVLVVICAVAYFAFCYWINASGSLLGRNANNAVSAEDMEQGTPIVINEEGRREGVFSLFIGATDEDETRTDSMMVMVFDTVNHTVNVINIPRDTLVHTKRTGTGKKINAAYGNGIEETLDDVQAVIGFRPDKYLVANFDGIADIVDALGGVDYEIPFDMSYHDYSQNLSIEFTAGMQHLDGEQVVEFLRWRHNDDGTGYEDGDIGRVEKLQGFLTTLGQTVLTPGNLLKIPTLASSVWSNVTTDLSTAQILWIGMQAMKVDMQNDVSMQTLIGDSAKINVGETLWFYVLDEDMVIDQINESFNPYIYQLDEDSFDIITPDDMGIYSKNWENERAVRYSSYETDATDEDAQNDRDNDSDDESDNDSDESVTRYYDDD